MEKPVTLTDFILQEEMRYPQATGKFTLLLNYIQEVGKIIASHIKKAGLVDVLGRSGNRNASGDEVQKLDESSNKLFKDTLLESGLVYALASEEEKKEVYSKKGGDYIVFFDPLDGSSNIDVNVTIGTIFSIYRKNDNILQKGVKQIAAGYIAYGSSVMFVYTSGSGVHSFTLDPSMGNFLLSKKNIKIPEEGVFYAINEGYSSLYNKKLLAYLSELKNGKKTYRLRYVGSMIADIHRTLVKGGIFIYPKDTKHPQGKLRLMYEVNPMSFIVQQAGGGITSLSQNPLEIQPISIHQTAPIALGSKKEVEKLLKYFS